MAEHVELGYATSTARSQGITVDETHTIATAAMAREDLYVAMSRGRALNRIYIALDQILATTHAELTATETWNTFHPEAAPPTPAIATQPALFGSLTPGWQAPTRPLGAPTRAPSSPDDPTLTSTGGTP